MNKKAALSISVNAIVVLILAITMLGLGIAFITKYFGGTLEQFDKVSQQIEEQVIDQVKSSGERLAFLSTKIELKKSETKSIYIGVRNDLSEAYTFSIDPDHLGSPVPAGQIGNSFSTSSPHTAQWNGMGSVIACYDAIDSVGTTALDTGAPGIADLASGLTGSTNNHIEFKTVKNRLIKRDEIVVLEMQVNAKPNAVRTTYSCAMVICEPSLTSVCTTGQEYARKDFFVTVIT